jgi:peptidyl-prolyl cis-trans isomerase D
VQPALLANARLMDSLFSEDAIKKRQNLEAIEVAPNTLVAARVVEHRPGGLLPLADVAGDIRTRLTSAAARKLAAEAGSKALEAARSGQGSVAFSAPMTVSRMRPLNLPPASVRAIFSADAGKLPSFVGVDTSDGYRIYRINRIVDAESAADRSEERRVGKECRRLCRSRWSPYH